MHLTYANKSFMEAFDLTEKDVEEGFDFSTLIHPDDIESFKKKYQVLFMPPYRGLHIHRSKTKSGEYRWYHWQGCAIFNKYNEIVEIQGNGRDITEEKRAKERLKNSQKQLKGITNSVNDAIIMFDEEGNISF